MISAVNRTALLRPFFEAVKELNFSNFELASLFTLLYSLQRYIVQIVFIF